ncbi:MAG TPA: alpha/beta hydrolase [Gemmatimonadales bacterium]|nr:alpha/beta hydrolase [Gemmatimonadales bacterium]
MIHRESSFLGAGDLELYRQSWQPDTPGGAAGAPSPGPVRGGVILVHGLGDHSGLYEPLVESLVSHGRAVHAFDLRGNGRSPGRRGHVHRWSDYRGDLGRFVALVRGEEPDSPLHLLGNSLGGLIVLDYALAGRDGLAGVVAVAPPLGRVGVPRALLALGRLVSRVWPSFSLNTGMNISALAHDPDVVAAVVSDPLFHRRASARLSTEIAAAAARVHAGAPRFAVPLLLVHGAADRMVLPEGTRALAASLAPAAAEYLEYPEGYHALLADQDRARVFGDIERWMRAHE